MNDEYSSRGVRVHEYSIGDYVLGGGEVAAMVMIEAITRLIPGVLGNPESLTEESHNSDG
jgi:tRNA (guanine37-N1)-methyltransferase